MMMMILMMMMMMMMMIAKMTNDGDKIDTSHNDDG